MPAPGFVALSDSLTNLVSGLGTTKDKGAIGEFAQRSTLSQSEIEALYQHSWLAGKVIDIPADDTTREWRQWYGSERDVETIETLERDLHLRQRVNSALKLAGKDGGCALMMGLPGAPSEEVVSETLRKGDLTFLHLVSRHELSVPDVVMDPMSPYYGRATEYRIFLPDGKVMGIHPSRVIPFVGAERFDKFRTRSPWGDSVLERCYEPIKHATACAQAAASLLQEMKIDVIRIPGLTENIGREEYRSLLIARFSLAMMTKSINNALLLDIDEEWTQKTLTLQGLPEIMEKLLQNTAGSGDMPVTRLLGRSPAGMNATGEADLEAYYTMVRARQETKIRPTLDPLDIAIVRSALGRRPRGLFYDWRPLWGLRAQEKAEINAKNAAAVADLAKASIFSPEALREGVVNDLEESGFLPGIRKAVEANIEVPIQPGEPQMLAAEAAAKGGPRPPSAPRPGSPAPRA